MIARLLFAACLIGTASFGQVTEKLIQQKLDAFNDQFEPEQLDLHLDKKLYFAGDRLWYAVYLNNIPRASSYLSGIVYIEVRSVSDSVIFRQKTRCVNGVGHGDLLLPRQMRSGSYKLAAYTLWSLNAGKALEFSLNIPIINVDLPLDDKIAEQREASIVLTGYDGTGNAGFKVNGPGTFVVADQDRVHFVGEAIAGQSNEFRVDLSRARGSWLSASLMDKDLNLTVHKTIRRESTGYSIVLRPSRAKIRTRERFEIQMEVADNEGRPVTANVSLSVYPKATSSVAVVPTCGPFPPSAIVESKGLSRETFLYPPSQRTLPPLPFSTPKGMPSPANLDAGFVKEVVTSLAMKKKTMRSYGSSLVYRPEVNYLLPANNVYSPSEFNTLPSLPEFIREVVPTVRVRKSKTGRKMFVRNSDNPDNIYFFKQPALLLVDGVVVEDTEKVLALPLDEVESLSVLWGINEVNKAGIFSLADNGIVSIITRSRTAFANSGQELLKGIHQPFLFALPGVEGKDESLPLFTDVLYWNPAIRLNGKDKVSLRASDDVETWIVELRGMTDSGDPIQAQAEFSVGAFPQ